MGEFTHVLHYGGQRYAVMTEHAQDIFEAMRKATLGTHGVAVMEATDLDTGESAVLNFLIGPGISIAVAGPPLSLG